MIGGIYAGGCVYAGLEGGIRFVVMRFLGWCLVRKYRISRDKRVWKAQFEGVLLHNVILYFVN